MPYNYNDESVKSIEHIVFAVKSRPLLMLFDNNEKEDFCSIYAMDANHSNYVGIPTMEEGVIYLPEDNFPNAETYIPKEEFSPETLPMVPLAVKNFEGSSPMILSECGFVSEDTYLKIVDNLDEGILQYMLTIYIVGVDKVENVFRVVDELHNLSSDDDIQIQNQANGLRNVVKDTTQILYILILLLCAMTIFIGFIIIYFATSLISKNARDLMILYLNGMSRVKISMYIYKYLQLRVNKVIVPACVLSLFLFYAITKFLLGRTEHFYWILILIIINLGVIFINALIYKIAIKRAVYKQTSNEKISKLIRN
jgi:hypothetical protein